MEMNVNVDFAGMYLPPDPSSTPMTANISQLPGHVGGNGGSCDSNGTDEYETFYRTAQYVTGLIIYPILCITGIIGNSLSLIVLSHKDMATSTNVYLLALGISDSLKLLNDFLYFIMLVISQHNPTAAETMMANVYPYAHYGFQVAVSVTAWLTVSVAVDRYISVCYPSTSKTLCTIPKARTVVTSVFVIMILLSIPSGFRYRLQTVHDTKNNITCMELVVTELGRNQQFMIPYTWVQNFLRGIIPVFILIFINARIINVLRKERVKGKKFNSRNRITIMLIAMVLIFILCITPDAIMSTFFGKGYVEEDFMVKGIREITDSLVALNSAVNFILYCSLSALFRNTFTRVFFGRRYVKMRGGSCKTVSRDGTTSVRSKNPKGSSGKKRGRGSPRNGHPDPHDDMESTTSEDHSPKMEVASNGFKKDTNDGKGGYKIIKEDSSQNDRCKRMEKNANDRKLTSHVYTGPVDSSVYTGPTDGVYCGPTDGVYCGPTDGVYCGPVDAVYCGPVKTSTAVNKGDTKVSVFVRQDSNSEGVQL